MYGLGWTSSRSNSEYSLLKPEDHGRQSIASDIEWEVSGEFLEPNDFPTDGSNWTRLHDGEPRTAARQGFAVELQDFIAAVGDHTLILCISIGFAIEERHSGGGVAYGVVEDSPAP